VLPVSVQVGDLLGGGNTFTNFHAPSSSSLFMNGAGVAAGQAATGIVVNGNHFLQKSQYISDWGVWVAHTGPYEEPGFDIEGNDFGPLSNGGVALSGPVVVDKLIDNSFHDNSMQLLPQWGWLGVGLLLSADATPSLTPLPVVQRARGNIFFGNDIGVEIRSGTTPVVVDAGPGSDFGSATDPGNNTFRCNSGLPSLLVGGGPGADVFSMFYSAARPSATIPFEGNVWDHAPPTVVGAPFPNAPQGTDVSIVTDDAGVPLGATFDVADASVAADAQPCPAGRVPGP
jgi:hypothetical protein